MKLVLSIAIWVIGGILTVLLFFVVLFLSIVTFPFDKKRKIANAQGFWWASALINLNPYWNLQISGLENIDPHKAYVVVANHQSLTDILVLYKTHMQFRWVAKENLFKIPFAGWCLSLGKHIRLSQKQPRSFKKAYCEIIDCLRSGISILFFPEGTRSSTGKMNGFQNGAFKIALKEKKPILPIFINGTRNVLPKKNWIFNTNVSGDLIVLPPIDTVDFRPRDFAYLRDIVYAKLKSVALRKGNALRAMGGPEGEFKPVNTKSAPALPKTVSIHTRQ